jgi:hypothetical protein
MPRAFRDFTRAGRWRERCFPCLMMENRAGPTGKKFGFIATGSRVGLGLSRDSFVLAISLSLTLAGGCGRIGLAHNPPVGEYDPGLSAPELTALDACRGGGKRAERVELDDGRAQMVRVWTAGGRELCRAYDADRNGAFETWQVVSGDRPASVGPSMQDNVIYDEYAVLHDPLRLECPLVYSVTGRRETLRTDRCNLLGDKGSPGARKRQRASTAAER